MRAFLASKLFVKKIILLVLTRKAKNTGPTGGTAKGTANGTRNLPNVCGCTVALDDWK